MNVDVISPSDGVASLQQVLELDNNLAERFCPETQLVENPWNSASFSVTSRWYKLRTHFKAMEGKIQQWCQNDTQTIADLGFLAPSAFGFQGGTTRCEQCACTTCDALAVLKKTCESLVISKQQLAHVEEEHAQAEREHAQTELEHAQAEEKRTNAENGMTPNGSSAKKDRTLELLANRVADRAKLVSSGINLVSRDANLVFRDAKLVFQAANDIYLAHREVWCLLEALGAAGNGTSLVTPWDLDLAKIPNQRSKARDDLEIGSSAPFATVCNLSEMEFGKLNFLPTLDADHQASLDPMYKNLKFVLGAAALLDRKDKDYHKKINATVRGINEWKTGKPTDQSTIKLYAPGCESQERDGAQPILYAIMFQMARVLGLERHITREQDIEKVENRTARRADFVVTQVEQHVLTITPAMLGIPIEVKPTTRKNAAVARLLLGAQDQLIGHLAKRALFSFDFGGIGEDCQVFGLELTMGSVAVIVLELSGVGTSDVKITTQRTKPVPLFDAETRQHLFGETAKDVEDSFGGVKEQEGMPAGFCLLARMLMSIQPGVGASLTNTSRCKSLSLRIANSESIRVGPHLGSGAHSHVFELDLNDTKDTFIKVPKSHHMRISLEREAEALQALPAHEGIPQLQFTKDPIKTLDMQIRCVMSTMPCLPLRGLIGRPASQHSWDSEDWKFIFLEVYTILKLAHGHGWAHLDVRPSNIITNGMSGSRRGPLKVMLIDWGCAHRTDSKLMKFEGCPPYAHDDLFGLTKKGWTPRLDHDLASLVYSVSSAFHGEIPWSGFSNHCAVPNDVRECRNEIARDVLRKLSKDWGLSPEMKKELLRAIGSKGNNKFRGNLRDRLGCLKRNRRRP